MNPWGYDRADGKEFPSIITPAQFAVLTQGRMSSTTEQVQDMLDAVSDAVRGFCGWHLAPALECAWVGDAPDGICQLPAMGVTVTSVEVGGAALDPSAYEWSESGLVRLPCRAPRWRSVRVEFTAGYDGGTGAIGAAVAQVAANALAASPGVREEHAGQVGISYNQTDNGVSGGLRLLESDRALLDPWRVRRI